MSPPQPPGQYPAYYPPPHQQPPKNGLGTAALVLGIIGVVFAVIPLFGIFVAIPLAVLALVFGTIGIVRVARHTANNKGSAIAGTSLGGLAFVLTIVMTAAVFGTGGSVTPTGKDVAGGPPAAPASGGSSSAPKPKKQTPDTHAEALKVGESGVVSQGGSDVGTLAISDVETYTSPTVEFGEAPVNGYYAKVTIQAEATEGRAFTLDSLDFVAITPNGQRYETGNGNALYEVGSGTMFDAVTLNPGETFEATVYFDVPNRHGEVAYADYMTGRVLGTWKY